MQFIDLQKQYEMLKKDIDANIYNVLNHGVYIGGKEVGCLSEKLAEYTHSNYCLTCANGTDALTIALRCYDVKCGDAVFIPDFTFFATAEVVALEGATPIFVDVDARTFNMDSNSLEEAIASVIQEGKLNLKAVITVDLFGLPADYQAIRAVADKYSLPIIEDAAQGFGGESNGKKACSFGDIATTSFFPAKPLGCYGDGGAIFTDNEKFYHLMKSLSVHGKGSDKYDNVRIGYNSRLDTLQASVLLAKLEAFKKYEFDYRNKIAQKYTALLNSKFVVPYVPQGYISSWAQYTLILGENIDRSRFQSYMKQKGIPTMVYYPIPMHAQTAFAGIKTYVDLSVSSNLAQRVLSIPIHPYLSDDDIRNVTDALLEYEE